MDLLSEGIKIVSEAKDWVTLVACIAFMIIFWEPIAQKLGWVKGEPAGTLPLGEKREIMADFRNAVTPLHLEMQTLSQHFNHETTSQNERTIELLQELVQSTREQGRKLDHLASGQDDMRINGVRVKR